MSEKEYSGGKVNYYEVEIKHPTREGREPYTAECNDVIEALGLSFAEGEAFKAIWRKGAARIFHGKRGHDSGLYDAEKAHFYGHRMEVIERHAIGKAMPATFGQQNTFEPASAMQDDSERMRVIGQSGEMASEVYAAIDLEVLRKRSPALATHYIGSCGPIMSAWYRQEGNEWFCLLDDGSDCRWDFSHTPVDLEHRLIKL